MLPPVPDVDVCILGAGPHGLAAATHLVEADPDLNLCVLDRSGQWLSTWHQQFRRAEIATLRSPVVHHPCADPYALSDFIDSQGHERSGLPYDLPTTHSFAHFCRALSEHHNLRPPLQASPQSIRNDGGMLTIDCGDRTITARSVVVAANPHRRQIPDWVWPLLGQRPGVIAHGLDIDLPAIDTLVGERVAVIGGGMTAAHLAIGAASRGAAVTLMTRRALNLRSFDTDPGWLGPKYLADFNDEPDPHRRIDMAREARNGGSIPSWMHDRLVAFDGPGNIDVIDSIEVDNAHLEANGTCCLALSNDSEMPVDRVWLACGTAPDASALRALRPLLEDTVSIDGFPVVDERLRLGPHPAYVMGRLATVALGPASGNLWGAQRAAHRITEAITGVDLTCCEIAPLSATG